MSRFRVKQISAVDAPAGESCVLFDGAQTIWQLIRYVQSFDSSNLDAENVYVAQHNLGRKYVNVSIYDDTDTQIFADRLWLIDENSVGMDFTSVKSWLDTATENSLKWTVVAT